MLSLNSSNNIIPYSNKERNKLTLVSDFNNEVINALNSGLSMFGNITEDLKMLKPIDTKPLEKVEFDKINEIVKVNSKPLTFENVLQIGTNKVNEDVGNIVNEVGNYIEELKMKFTLPVLIGFGLLLVLLLRK